MKKVIVFLILLLSFCYGDTVRNVGIAKYAVLEVLQDRAPLRAETDEYAQRLGHFIKDTVLFADKETDDYYRVELDENTYGWINKRDVEVQAIIPEKRFDGISKINFREDKRKYTIEILTQSKSGYLFKETAEGLDFTLYDNRYDPYHVKISNKRGAFNLSPKYDNKLKINYSTPLPLFGYDISAFDRGYILNIKKPPKISRRRPLKGIKIVIDAGHGGDEFGAVGFGVKEKDINLQISKKLRRELKKRGAKVFLTRKKDKKVALYDRVDFAKQVNADILLSIHQNSLPDPENIEQKHGVGVYYYNPQAKPLADALQNNLLIATGFQDDGINEASFALTRPTSQISVLIECGYMIYKYELEKLKDKKFQKKIVRAITKGTEDYLRASFAKNRK